MDNIAGDSTPVEKGGSAPQPFYSEFSQINNPNVAEGLAYIEENQGRGAAILRENALREEHETGLTEKERRNSEIADMLAEEFPDAFVKSVDDNGTEIFATGLRAVHFDEVIFKSQSLSPSKGKELLKDLRIINNEVNDHLSSSKGDILYYLTDNSKGGNVFISKYGISVGLGEKFDINDNLKFAHYEDSIGVFPDEELRIFFEALKFLDKVGKIRKEIVIEKERKRMSVEDFRNLAQQIKNT